MAKRKVKVVKAPGKGRRVGDQMGYGLYRGQSIRDFNAFTETDPHTDLRNVFPEVPRNQANIEVEKGEKIIAKDGMSIYDVGGKKHSQGGTPVKAEPGSYVLSDFIKAPKMMQAKMGFEVKSNKGKDNTWARVLESKVSTKDYNKLAEFLRQAAAGGDVDRYELATAKNKMAVYQDYVSKAALGNELTKMMQGKDYKIPEIGIPALQKMFPEMAQKMMGGGAPNPGGPEPNGVQEYPQGQEPMMAYGGTYYNLPQALEGDEASIPLDIIPWLRGKTKAGSYTPTGVSNRYNRDDQYIQAWADALGMDFNDLKKMGNKQVQSLIYDWTLQNNPQAINQMWKTYGLTNLGKKYKDLVSMTSRDAKGRPTYKFDKDLTNQQLGTLKKAYVDNLFGVRQLEPSPTGEPPRIKIPGGDEFIPPPEEEIPGDTPPSEGTKWFCDTVKGGVTPVPANMANNAPGSSITYYNTKEEAEAACGTTKTTTRPPDTTITNIPPTDIPRLPYEQDVINLGTALVNKYGYRDVYPWRKRANAIGWDPAFYSTAAQEALLNSQAKGAMEDASLYAGTPQVQAARQQQAQLASIPALMQARMQTNQANIGQDTQARISNAAIYNQAGMQDALMANQLMDMNAKFIHNKDVSRAKSNVDVANQLNDMLTHSGDTYLMNQWYPQEAFNPLTYRTYFHNGKSIKDEAAPTEADFGTDYTTAVQMAKAQGLTSPKDIHDAAMDIVEYKRGKPSNRPSRRTAASTNQMTYSDPTASDNAVVGYKKGGTFVPMYIVGGLW